MMAWKGHTVQQMPQPLQWSKSKSRRFPSFTGMEEPDVPAVLSRYIESAKVYNLTGCSMRDALYFVSAEKPVIAGKRVDFDLDHCKGCGICWNVCPFHAIEMRKEVRE